MSVSRSIVLLLCVSLAACDKPRAEPADHPAAETGKESFGRLTVDELTARMSDAKAGKGKLAIFDNNQREDFDKGHIPGARWVDFKDVKASDLPADKDTPLVFYCSSEH